MDTNDDYYKLTLQQQRFCDEYLIHFNAFKAAANAGYSENTARKGELLHLPKIQLYLKEQMRRTQSRLQITHDMILTELAKIAFSNMGNYFDEYAVLKPMHKLTTDEKAAISQYQVLDATDEYGHRVGELSKIKLHNKMAALDKIARHLGFYEVSRKSESPEVGKMEEVLGRKESPKSESPEVRKMEEVLGRKESPKSESPEVSTVEEEAENMENILTLSPLRQLLNDRMIDGLNSAMIDGLNDRVIELNKEIHLQNAELSSEIATSSQPLAGELLAMTFGDGFALGTGADTGPVAKACAV